MNTTRNDPLTRRKGTIEMEKLLLNLQTFDDGASAGTSAGEGTAAENTQGVAAPTVKGRKDNNLQNVVYGKQDVSDDYSLQTKLPGAEKTVTTKETEERSVQFENMIKGDYKDEFNNRVQKIVQGRIGDTKALQEQNAKMQPIIDMMSRKYGVDASNIDHLQRQSRTMTLFSRMRRQKKECQWNSTKSTGKWNQKMNI